jgi:hypothetical protein
LIESGTPKPPDAIPADADWANHYWNEYQYRHEKWWHTFYRSIWFIGILGAVPWIPWIREKFAKEIAEAGVRVVYGLLPLAFFALVVSSLVDQFDESRLAECRLEIYRGNKWKKPVHFAAFKKGVWWMTSLFIGVMVLAWVVWFRFLLRLS